MALFTHVQILMSVVIVSLAAQRLSPIKIEPSAPTVDVGKSIALRAVDDAGQAVAAKWSISDPLVASISAQGVVTGRAAGRAVVRARSKNSLAETTVMVRAIETATETDGWFSDEHTSLHIPFHRHRSRVQWHP